MRRYSPTISVLHSPVDKIREVIRYIRTEINAEKLENILSIKIAGKESGELLIYLAMLVYTVIFSYFTIQKHNAFRTFAWDLGISQQALWTTLNSGRLFYYTPELFFNPTGSFFGLHFSPILFLLLPIYAICQKPETLLVFQSFVISLSSLPLYWFARKSLNSKLVAVGFSLSYLLYPPLQGANWFDFHVQCFLPLFFFSAIYCLENEKWGKYFIFLVLALSIAENVPLVVIFIGIYGFFKHRNILLDLFKHKKPTDKRILVPFFTITMAFIWLLFARYIQNSFFPVDPVFDSFYRAIDYWSVLGIKGDPVSMPLYLVLNPLSALQALTYDAFAKLLFVTLIFGSLMFLSFRSAILLITLPSLGPALLSNHQPFYVMGVHYPLYYIPFIFLAAIVGLKRQSHQLPPSNMSKRIRNILILMLAFSVFASPLSPLLLTSNVSIPHFSEYRLPSITEHEISLQKIGELIPQNASILTQNNIFPHFANRENAYVFPLVHIFNYAPKEVDEYTNHLFSISDYVLIDLLYDEYSGRFFLEKMREYNVNFTLMEYYDGIILLKKYT